MSISPAKKRLIRQRAGERCEYCHADERWQFVLFTVDHVTPRSLGGDDTADNLALACRNCNERRSNRREGTDSTTAEPAPLFDPRLDTWSDHFVWSQDRLRIVGRTPAGRATVALLDMNDDLHGSACLRVRRRDMSDGYHPPAGDPVME
ncbi:MAG: HNH endonuclease [Planctomycetales bacterium]|nr:HNH endonuclease [Planctomycetales bacterium]